MAGDRAKPGTTTAHRYRTLLAWHGTTAGGYDAYPRAHVVTSPPATGELHLSSDAHFLGDAARLNPEQLLVAAASSCQLLSFLAVAARARIDVRRYEDDAVGEMPERRAPMAIESITLRPRIVVGPGCSGDRLRHLVDVAHRGCFIANSLRCEVRVEPTFVVDSTYAFADSDPAARRLAMVAWIFEPPSRAFLTSVLSGRPAPACAVDLGCGPGNTTALLAEVSGAERTIGLDASEHFLELARAAAAPGTAFELHDLERPRWPIADPALRGRYPGLAYGRLVLAHLREPVVAAMTWLDELAPGGLLLVDELEWIRTDEPALQHYLELVTELVAAHGSAMFAGPIVAALEPSLLARQIWNDVVEWPVEIADAAAMFALNLSVWRSDPVVSSLLASDDELDRLADQLDRLAETGSAGSIVWGLRQVAFERSA
jgi:organic hydroperoxide reductase OsmC/OhrA/SAM-dependent methyltransferase